MAASHVKNAVGINKVLGGASPGSDRPVGFVNAHLAGAFNAAFAPGAADFFAWIRFVSRASINHTQTLMSYMNLAGLGWSFEFRANNVANVDTLQITMDDGVNSHQQRGVATVAGDLARHTALVSVVAGTLDIYLDGVTDILATFVPTTTLTNLAGSEFRIGSNNQTTPIKDADLIIEEAAWGNQGFGITAGEAVTLHNGGQSHDLSILGFYTKFTNWWHAEDAGSINPTIIDQRAAQTLTLIGGSKRSYFSWPDFPVFKGVDFAFVPPPEPVIFKGIDFVALLKPKIKGWEIAFPSTVVFAPKIKGWEVAFPSTVVLAPKIQAWEAAMFPNPPGPEVVSASWEVGTTKILDVSASGIEAALDESLIAFPPTLNKLIPDLSVRQLNLLDFTFDADTFIVDPRSTDQTIEYTATLVDDSPLPAWLNFDGAIRRFLGVPGVEDVGTFTVKLTATLNPSTITTFTITVLPAFFEPLFPEGISYGSSGGPGFNTSVIEVDSGQEQRVARWTGARRRYNAALAIKDQDEMSQLITFYLSVRGSADNFRYKDFLDFTTARGPLPAREHTDPPAFDDVVIGVGDGATKQFQLLKNYQAKDKVQVRPLTQPIGGKVFLGVDSVEKFEEVDWTVDTTTGIVTFTIAPPDGVDITGGCEFHVPARFGKEADNLMAMTIDSFRTGSATDIPILEIREEDKINDDFFYGGAIAQTMTADLQLSREMGRVIRLNAPTPNLEAILPAVNLLLTGGPYFYIINTGTNLIRLVTEPDAPTGQEIANLLQDDSVLMVLGLDDVGAKVWIAL